MSSAERPYNQSAEKPYHQLLVDEFHALLATRYDAVVQRLLYPELGHAAFTNRIHYAAQDTSSAMINGNQLEVTPYDPLTFLPRTTVNTINEVKERIIEQDPSVAQLRDFAQMSRLVLENMTDMFDDKTPINQLSFLLSCGLIGACHKPRVKDVQAVLKPSKTGERSSTSDIVFRQAVKMLVSKSLRPGEEEVLEGIVLKVVAQPHKVLPKNQEKYMRNINHFYQGRLAKQILAALFDPFTTRQHTFDELNVLHGHVDPVYRPEPLPDMPVPIVDMPYPIFPPDSRQATEEIRPPRPNSGKRHTIIDDLRTKWLGDLVLRWPFGGGVTPVALHNKRFSKEVDAELSEMLQSDNEESGKKNYKNRYQAAVLNGPEGEPFVVIADTDIAHPKNGLYIGFIKDLRNARGRAVHWRVVFRSHKEVARSFGAVRYNHDKQDLHEQIVKLVLDTFEQHYKEPRPTLLQPPRPLRVA